jgi:hypothetical protein
LVSLLFIFAALFEYAFLLMKKRRSLRTKFQNKIASKLCKQKSSEDKIILEEDKSEVEISRIWELKSNYADCIIDEIAFCVFICLLILFNIVYWLYYYY